MRENCLTKTPLRGICVKQVPRGNEREFRFHDQFQLHSTVSQMIYWPILIFNGFGPVLSVDP